MERLNLRLLVRIVARNYMPPIEFVLLRFAIADSGAWLGSHRVGHIKVTMRVFMGCSGFPSTRRQLKVAITVRCPFRATREELTAPYRNRDHS